MDPGGLIMTYEQAWNELKDLMKRGVNDGIIYGFSKEDGSNAKEHGMFRSYERVLDKMNKLEKEIK